MAAPTLIFLHNLRCTGNTFNMFVLHRHLHDTLKTGVVGEHNFTWDEVRRAANRKRPRFVLGHHTYGVHQELTGPQPCEYFVNLRRPVDRLISLYAKWSATEGAGLRAYLQAHEQANNGMVRRLLGQSRRDDGRWYDHVAQAPLPEGPPPPITEADYAVAEERLRTECRSILLTERFVESVVLFERTHGLGPLVSLTSMRFNQNPTFLKPRHISPADREWIDANNAFDERLYRRAAELLDEQLSQQDAAFWEDVRIRRILADMLTVPRQNVLDGADLGDRIAQGFEQLLRFGMNSEVLGVAALVVGDPGVTPTFKQNLVATLSRYVSDDERGRLEGLLKA